MLRALGVGGPAVDTVLANPNCRPGEMLTGEVRVQGGDHDVEIEHIALSLVTRVEVERGDNEFNATTEFQRLVVAPRFHLAAREQRVIPFQFPVPWEAPLTHVLGHPLHGMLIGLHTELAVARAVDKSDADPVAIHPLPAQEQVLNAFAQLGFQFRSADLEAGQIYGVHQELPFYQEIEFLPPPAYAGRINEVELTFVTNPHEIVVVLEADKRRGLFRSGGDQFGRFHARLDEAMHIDWVGNINQWLAQVADMYAAPGFAPGHPAPGMPLAQPGYPPQAYPPPAHPVHGEHHGHRGPGIGGVVAGAAAGFLGGMIMGEVLDEIGDAFEGEEE